MTLCRDLRPPRPWGLALGVVLLTSACGGSGVVATSTASLAPVPRLQDGTCSSAREVLSLEATRTQVQAGDQALQIATQARMLNALAGVRGGLSIDRDGEYLDAVNSLSLNLPTIGAQADPLVSRAVVSSTSAVQRLVDERCS